MRQNVAELVKLDVLKNISSDQKVSRFGQRIFADDARVEFRYLISFELAELNKSFLQGTATATIVEYRLRPDLPRKGRDRDPVMVSRTAPTGPFITLL